MKRLKEDTSINFEYEDRSDLIYFVVNTEQLLGVPISYPGIRSAIKKAYLDSKQVTPIDTGLMRSSYSIQYISTNRAMMFFDPHKIIGKVRRGRKVKEYYPKYLAEKRSTFNWLDVVMLTFFRSLMASVKEINKKNSEAEAQKNKSEEKKHQRDKLINITMFLSFMKLLKENQKDKIQKGG